MTDDHIEIPVSKPISGSIKIPGSKSISNRALLVAALAKGNTLLTGFLDSDDTHYMQNAWEKLGVECKITNDQMTIKGCGGKITPSKEEIYIGNAGTAARFLTAVLTLGKGCYLLTGNKRMQERPIDDLIVALNSIGAAVKDVGKNGCPPLSIQGTGLIGGNIQIPGDKSSQYISALMLSAPYSQKGMKISILGNLVSKTYVDMTMKVMRDFNAMCDWTDEKTIQVYPNHPYKAKNYTIESDASSASYFMGMAAITGGTISIGDFKQDSTQGDLQLKDLLEKMGCQVHWNNQNIVIQGGALSAIDVDMNTMSDVAPTLAVVALFAQGTTKITNIANMRIKECDRISAITTELRKLGATIEEWDSGLSIKGECKLSGCELETYDDHRMAMAFSLVGLKVPGVKIQDPKCVSKTFPDYFDRFFSLIA